ncbi:MAG: transposase [Okeania sp. SIO3B5]|uniref:IS110 family transposase n=1 Tax=Okeania sp. SIO3B5 TaxID=2607811 RepID=UPI00140147D3|nr:transposase [Okeania sp. SIO3B5]NEO56571.1 transposase [Okeania sp. SIO3B5]
MYEKITIGGVFPTDIGYTRNKFEIEYRLEEGESILKKYFKEHRRGMCKKFSLKTESVEDFVNFLQGADCLILEPTGVHYSYLWQHISSHHGVPVKWVSHPEIKYIRKSERLPDKNDAADALALAFYGLKNLAVEEAFINFDGGKVRKISELYLNSKSLKSVNTALTNKCRAKLSKEFPEAAFKQSPQSEKDGLSPLFAWLCNKQRFISCPDD